MLVRQVYQVPMVTLRLINETERQAIFSNIQELYAIHKELSDAFTAVRSPTEGVQSLADILASFIPKVRELVCWLVWCRSIDLEN